MPWCRALFGLSVSGELDAKQSYDSQALQKVVQRNAPWIDCPVLQPPITSQPLAVAEGSGNK